LEKTDRHGLGHLINLSREPGEQKHHPMWLKTSDTAFIQGRVPRGVRFEVTLVLSDFKVWCGEHSQEGEWSDDHMMSGRMEVIYPNKSSSGNTPSQSRGVREGLYGKVGGPSSTGHASYKSKPGAAEIE